MRAVGLCLRFAAERYNIVCARLNKLTPAFQSSIFFLFRRLLLCGFCVYRYLADFLEGSWVLVVAGVYSRIVGPHVALSPRCFV